MPIYEYACDACGHKLEKLQKISDDPLKDCPACDKAELTKLISAAAFRLKGEGWYETDFKTGGKKNLLHSPSDSGKPESSAKDSANGSEAKSSNTKSEGSSDSSTASKASKSDKSGKSKADATS